MDAVTIPGWLAQGVISFGAGVLSTLAVLWITGRLRPRRTGPSTPPWWVQHVFTPGFFVTVFSFLILLVISSVWIYSVIDDSDGPTPTGKPLTATSTQPTPFP